MFLFKIGANRSFRFLGRDGYGSENFAKICQDFHIQSIPHHDTVRNVFVRLPFEEVEKVGVEMCRSLLRNKTLCQFRLLDSHYLLAIDGTQQVTFKKRHCLKCLKTKRNDGTIFYHHNILEAKIVCRNGFAIPIATEFIENPGLNYDKQDCETKAAYRLLKRVKQYFPQLRICLLADALYVNQNIIDICEDSNWKFIITFKEGSAKSLWSDYIDFKNIKYCSHTERKIYNKENYITQNEKYFWKNNLEYHGHALSVFELDIENATNQKRFMFMSNYYATDENILDLINKGGRQRWKIENCFNEEKNGGYHLEHLYSENENAMKVYVYFLQIAHVLNSIMELGIITKKVIQKRYGSIKNVTEIIFAHFRYKILSLDVDDAVNVIFSSA